VDQAEAEAEMLARLVVLEIHLALLQAKVVMLARRLLVVFSLAAAVAVVQAQLDRLARLVMVAQGAQAQHQALQELLQPMLEVVEAVEKLVLVVLVDQAVVVLARLVQLQNPEMGLHLLALAEAEVAVEAQVAETAVLAS
jgi:hypothetical protein